jgi:hypothetical protein
MHPENRRKLADRVAKAAEAALAARSYVSCIDVLVGIGWLDPGAVQRWRQGQIDYLEGSIQTNLSRISEAMKLFRSWAGAKGLVASETHYVARSPRRETLRFSKSGNPTIEQLYRTHWVSAALSKGKRERLAQKTSRPPELVVVSPLNDAWTCHRCGGSGNLLMMENPGPACLRCVGLDDLAFLSAGEMRCSRAGPGLKARAMPSWCASARADSAMSGKVCWSRRKPWRRRDASSRIRRKGKKRFELCTAMGTGRGWGHRHKSSARPRRKGG